MIFSAGNVLRLTARPPGAVSSTRPAQEMAAGEFEAALPDWTVAIMCGLKATAAFRSSPNSLTAVIHNARLPLKHELSHWKVTRNQGGRELKTRGPHPAAMSFASAMPVDQSRASLGRDLLGIAAGAHFVGAGLLLASPPSVRHALADIGYSPLIGPPIAGFLAGAGLLLIMTRAAGLGAVLSTALLAAGLASHIQTGQMFSVGAFFCAGLVVTVWLGLGLADRRVGCLLLCELDAP